MEQTGEYRIAASRERVWTALNDPVVLGRCIEGCQSLERVADDRFDAAIKARVGPVSALFNAELTLADVDAPSAYTLHAQVKGGAAGFARGQARVELEDAGPETLLRYAVQANVGGKLAQVGSRLIDAAARKLADDFFAAFGRELGGVVSAAAAPVPSPAPGAAAPPRVYEPSAQWKIWLAVFIALVVALVLAL
ncbi:MAG: carbon monoxide dehydrogenase subunit G [Pseudomonadales bacterium]|nr:carbon monoxide dehydrogenase subunit G [Pseudomonadales bacterium]